MATLSFAIFDTEIGPCAIAWTVNPDRQPRVARFYLPEATREETQGRIAQHCRSDRPEEPPPAICALIDRVRIHLHGSLQDFSGVDVDLTDAGPLECAVYEAARQIPAGQVRTYGEIARAVGRPGAARAVGQALGKNPIALIVPCHRVQATGGRSGGFSAHGGRETKARILAIEGAILL